VSILLMTPSFSNADLTIFSDNKPLNEAIIQLLNKNLIKNSNHFSYHVRQIRHTVFSAAWEITCNNVTYYLKHNPEHFIHEGKLLSFLNGSSFSVPKMIAYDNQFNLCLTQSCGNETLRQNFIFEYCHQALTEYAKIQNTLINHKDSLQALGLPVISSEDLINSILWVKMHEKDFGVCLNFSSLNFSLMKKELDILLAYNNLSIGHQDFHDGNIVINQGKIFIIDWSESALCNPLFSAIQAIDKMSAIYQLNDTDKNKLIENYLTNIPFFIFPFEKKLYLELLQRYLKYYYLFTLKPIISLSEVSKWKNYQNHVRFIFSDLLN
jgi:aminoglycoside/choline kinase family phosphotransferase